MQGTNITTAMSTAVHDLLPVELQDVMSLTHQAGLKVVHEEAALGGLIRLLHTQRG
jgi:hypothetical protein